MSEKKPDKHHGHGGSYVVKNGARELVERTEVLDQHGDKVIEKDKGGKRKVVERPKPEESAAGAPAEARKEVK